MTAIRIFLALFALLASTGSSAAAAQTPGCGFYAQVERACPCGDSGYALGYGRKYCRRIMAEDRLSPLGRQWRAAAVICLQEKLRAALPQTGCDCRAIRNKAYAAHYSCYAKGAISICDLPLEDIVRIDASIDDADKTGARGFGVVVRLALRCFADNPKRARAAFRAIGRVETRQ